MKTKIAVIVVIVILALLIVLQVTLLGCKPDGETKEKAKEVKIETRSNYVFKKI
jgi:flagellar basal body-associated protein FliL